MQRHFESEDHTEFTFYLCFWSARVFYSTMSVPITILAHIFRHISRDSWRCVYAAHGEGNRWQSAFTWKLLQCRKLKWFLVSEMREMQNEFSLSNFRVARKIEWKTIATSPFRITHDMQRTVISRIAQWLKVEKKKWRKRIEEKVKAKNGHIVCATVRHQSACRHAARDRDVHTFDLRWKQEAN